MTFKAMTELWTGLQSHSIPSSLVDFEQKHQRNLSQLTFGSAWKREKTTSTFIVKTRRFK